MFGALLIRGKKSELPKNASCAAVFRHYAQIDPFKLDFPECSAAIARMSSKLEENSIKMGHATRDSDGDLKNFNSAAYAPEIMVLRSFATSMAYSHELERWFNYRRYDLVDELNESFPLSRIRQIWRRASCETDLLPLIEEVLNIQSDIYSYDGIDLQRPRVDLFTPKENSTIEGTVYIDAGDLSDGIMPTINLSRTLFGDSTPNRALDVAHHEYIHRVLAELASAFMRGHMDHKHPFYNDAYMEAEKIKARAIIDSEIYEAYRSQPEEVLCYEQQQRFSREFLVL